MLKTRTYLKKVIKRTNIFESIDWICVMLYAILVLLGWLNIYAAVFNEDHKSIFDLSQRYGKQMLWIFAAIILLLAVLMVESKFYAFFAYPIYSLAIVSLMGVLILGHEVHGAKAWFEIGGFSFQPAEFAKFASALAFSKYLSSYGLKINSAKSLIRVGLLLAIPSGLILLQNDTGSALVYTCFALVMFREGLHSNHLVFASLAVVIFFLTLIMPLSFVYILLIAGAVGVFFFIYRNLIESLLGSLMFTGIACIFYLLSYYRFHWEFHNVLFFSVAVSAPLLIVLAYYRRLYKVFYIIPILLFAIGFSFSVELVFKHVLEDHQQKRINDLLGIEYDPLGAGYNVNQSKIAIGSGGFLGKGFLQGTQTKFNFVPEQDTDFIFCTVGEEWGFAGTFVVLSLFLVLLIRLIYLAERQRSAFSRIYGYSVASILFFHIAVNIGMTIGLTPVIGIPLPFFSYGGSSLWAFTILLFIFLRLDSERLELIG